MVKKHYTTAVTLLLMVALSAWSMDASAQSKGALKKKHAVSSGRGTHKSSHANRRNRKMHLGISITLKRTTRHIDWDATSAHVTELFQQQKGHLCWPVDSRKVMTRYGYQPYELAPSVRVNNLGINIAIDQDSSVRVVYDGIVDDVMDIGDAKAVMVLHGKYFTIYSDLSTATVVKGQQVMAGDVIGQVGETGQVDFRIYDPYDVWQDPEKWLVRGK